MAKKKNYNNFVFKILPIILICSLQSLIVCFYILIKYQDKLILEYLKNSNSQNFKTVYINYFTASEIVLILLSFTFIKYFDSFCLLIFFCFLSVLCEIFIFKNFICKNIIIIYLFSFIQGIAFHAIKVLMKICIYRFFSNSKESNKKNLSGYISFAYMIPYLIGIPLISIVNNQCSKIKNIKIVYKKFFPIIFVSIPFSILAFIIFKFSNNQKVEKKLKNKNNTKNNGLSIYENFKKNIVFFISCMLLRSLHYIYDLRKSAFYDLLLGGEKINVVKWLNKLPCLLSPFISFYFFKYLESLKKGYIFSSLLFFLGCILSLYQYLYKIKHNIFSMILQMIFGVSEVLFKITSSSTILQICSKESKNSIIALIDGLQASISIIINSLCFYIFNEINKIESYFYFFVSFSFLSFINLILSINYDIS